MSKIVVRLPCYVCSCVDVGGASTSGEILVVVVVGVVVVIRGGRVVVGYRWVA